MPIDLLEIEAAFADPFLMEMDWTSVPMTRVLRLEVGEFDHFEPLWQFLRMRGVKDIYYSRDFLLLPLHITAASQVISSLWPEIHRTRTFFHVDDDPFWKMRDLLERIAANGGALLALCD